MLTIVLKVNQKNGIVILPKRVRETLKIDDTIILSIDEQDPKPVAQISVPKYSIEDVLYNLPPLKSGKIFKKEDVENTIADESIKRYKKASL